MNTSTAPVRDLEKFTVFTAEIDLARPAGGTAKEYPRFIYAEGGAVAVKQATRADTMVIPAGIVANGFPYCGAVSILPAASGTSATAVWVGW